MDKMTFHEFSIKHGLLNHIVKNQVIVNSKLDFILHYFVEKEGLDKTEMEASVEKYVNEAMIKSFHEIQDLLEKMEDLTDSVYTKGL